MINVNELRVGNIIRHVNVNGTFDLHVMSIHKDGYIAVRPSRGGEWGMLQEDFEPILLTEEILLKCGIKYSQGFYNLTDEVRISVDNFNVYAEPDNEIMIWIGIECKYLHQLQNLYFALTRQELKFDFNG